MVAWCLVARPQLYVGHPKKEIRGANPQCCYGQPAHERRSQPKWIRCARHRRWDDVLGIIHRRFVAVGRTSSSAPDRLVRLSLPHHRQPARETPPAFFSTQPQTSEMQARPPQVASRFRPDPAALGAAVRYPDLPTKPELFPEKAVSRVLTSFVRHADLSLMFT